MTAGDGGWQGAWNRVGYRRRIGLLLILAFALLMAAGVTWSMANPRLNNYRPAVAEVVSVSEASPTAITVRFTTIDEEAVEATTDRLTFVPPEGAPVPVIYDPADPEQVAMEGYNESSLLTTVIIGAFAVTLGAAFLTFRHRHD